MLNARSIWAWIWKYDFVLIIFGIGRKIMLDIKLLRNNFEEVELDVNDNEEIYKIIERISHGGFSFVYLGTDLRNGKSVAIKEFIPNSKKVGV